MKYSAFGLFSPFLLYAFRDKIPLLSYLTSENDNSVVCEATQTKEFKVSFNPRNVLYNQMVSQESEFLQCLNVITHSLNSSEIPPL